MAESAVGEVLEGLWRFEALHPDWTEEEGGEEGWEQNVAWWAVAAPSGVVLVDPLVEDWEALDRLIAKHGGCAGIIRTIHWHRRSIDEAARRYDVEVWARQPPEGAPHQPFDHAAGDQAEVLGGIRVFDMERADEIALWLPDQSALVFGDVMLRRESGELRVCPDSWEQPDGGPARVRSLLRDLTTLPVEHVLVSHGPLVLGDGLAALTAATG
jgi:glyoxylase-like metal-dependent hydrolase (beta-lactamase superfamily II)